MDELHQACVCQAEALKSMLKYLDTKAALNEETITMLYTLDALSQSDQDLIDAKIKELDEENNDIYMTGEQLQATQLEVEAVLAKFAKP